jgi:phycocyanobilin lyase subunit beta
MRFVAPWQNDQTIAIDCVIDSFLFHSLFFPMADTLHTLIAAVDAADSAASLLEAVQQLSQARLEGAIPTLIAALSYNNPGAAVAAVEGLVQIGQPAVPALLDQLDRHNYTARAWAIRALAGIGDPRGLTTLLGAATADFALSVRRAAARGLGTLKWHQFGAEELEMAQAEALDALLFVCDDDEWVVRYAAVTGLQTLAVAIWHHHPDWRVPIFAKLEQVASEDSVWAVRARVWLAQAELQQLPEQPDAMADAPVNEIIANWRSTLENLYRRKSQERPFPEGDPRRFRGLAASITQNPAG